MTILDDQRVIAIEEHYLDSNVVSHFPGKGANFDGPLRAQLDEIGAARIKSMDASGIDVQVLSHAPPGTQRLDAETGVRVARQANDALHEIFAL